MLTPSFTFKYRAHFYASAALATTMRMIVDKISTAPLCCFSPFIDLELMQKCPPALLLSLGSFKYPASECMFKIISLAW
jgi:hypothetical protein